MASVVHTYYPVSAGHKRQVADGISVADYVGTTGLDSRGPVVCSFNGRPAFRSEWPGLVILEHDVVVFIHLPQGGDGGSSPVRIVAMIGLIALSLYAPQLVPSIAAWGGGFGGSLISAGVMMAGSAIMNAVMPIKNPDSAQRQISYANSTSVYSLSSPTNAPRFGQVIPVQYGRLKTTPPLISQPWSEYIDNDQFVYILLCIGQGYYEIEDILFDDLSINQIPGIEFEVVNPGEACPYHDNVYTSPYITGQEIAREVAGAETEPGKCYFIYDSTNLSNVNEPRMVNGVFTLFVPSGVSNNGWDLRDGDGGCIISAGDTFKVSGGDINPMNIYDNYTVEQVDVYFYNEMWGFFIKVVEPLPDLEYCWGVNCDNYQSSNNNVLTLGSRDIIYYAGYPSLGSVNYGQTYSFDIVFPNGLYSVNPDTGDLQSAEVTVNIYVKLVNPTTGLFIDDVPHSYGGDFVITGAGRTPVRRTITLPIYIQDGTNTNVSYQVSVSRSAVPPNGNLCDDCIWAGLRVFMEHRLVYNDVTSVALKAKASAGFNNDFLSRISVLSTRRLPIWNGTVWSAPTATRSIAWAAADACRNAIYSIGLNDSSIDLDQLLALDALWTNRGDLCDGIFDTKATFWDSIKTILRTGRAQPHMVGGSITFSRDQEQTVIKGVFGVRNIVRGSFSIDYLMFDPDTPDDIEVEYFDEDSWVWKSVVCTLPGSSSDSPASIKKWGIAQADQARREGLYDAACNMHRRTFVTFQTEMDARIILRGDLVSVSHPLPSWGSSGEIRGVSGQVLELSEPVAFGSGDHYISFRKPDGSQDGPYLITEGDDSYHVVMTDLIPNHVYYGYSRERTHYQFGTGSLFERRCLVLSATPRATHKIEILCVVENSAVHSADGVPNGQ